MYFTLCFGSLTTSSTSFAGLCNFNKSSVVISSIGFFKISPAAFLLNKVLPACLDLFLNQADKSALSLISFTPALPITLSPKLFENEPTISFTVLSGRYFIASPIKFDRLSSSPLAT